MRIIVDAMGGDFAPEETVKGCLLALGRAEGFELELIGNKKLINQLLGGNTEFRKRITTTHASECITKDRKSVV